jgi:hypothetical protein
MGQIAKANFKVSKWDQVAIADVGSGPEWGRATVLKRFEGALVGESRAELLLAGAPEGGAGYIAQERFTGKLGDREGTFDMQHGGAALPDGSTLHQFGYVVPNSGTGGLAGLSGTVLFRHDDDGAVFTLTYELPEPAA